MKPSLPENSAAGVYVNDPSALKRERAVGRAGAERDGQRVAVGVGVVGQHALVRGDREHGVFRRGVRVRRADRRIRHRRDRDRHFGGVALVGAVGGAVGEMSVPKKSASGV